MLTGFSGAVIGAVAAVWGLILAAAYAVGRWHRRKDDASKRLEAMRKAKEIREDVENASDQRLVDILTGRVQR